MRRRLLAALILGGLLAVPGAGVAVWADTSSGTAYALSGDADSAAVEVTMLATTFSTTPLVDGQFPHAQADLARSQATAHGSVFDPGALVQTLPYEFAANCPPPSPLPSVTPPGGCPQFPAWPFGATADNSHPNLSGSVAGQAVGPFSFGAGEYNLVAGPGSAAADANGGRATLNAAQPITVASGSAHATVRVEGSTVVSQVADRLQGITIAGVIDIGAIDSTVLTRAVAGVPGAVTGNLTVTGVTVAGQAASIDQTGLHLLGQTLPLPLDPAEQALQQLSQSGLSIKLLQPRQVISAGHGAYNGAAIEITETSPQDGSGFSILLGPARASAVAVPFHVFAPAGFGFAGLSGGSGPTLSSLPGGTLPPPAAYGTSGGGPVFKLLGLPLTPRALLLVLLGLLELSLLGAGTALFWPRAVPAPAATLRPL